MIKALILLTSISIILNIIMLISFKKLSTTTYNRFIDIYSGLVQLAENDNNLTKRIKLNRAYLQYCLVCLRPYMIAIQNKATAREDYEEAQECIKIIKQIEELIQFDEDKNNNKQSKA